jgi:hypothetical protein
MACGLALHLAFSVGFGGFLFVFALSVQDGLHADALVGGLAVVPMAAPFLVGSILSPKIINRFGRAAMAGGAILQAAGLALVIAVIVTGWPHVAIINLAGPLTLLGFGQSMMSTGLCRVVLVDVPAHQAGIGSVLVTMQRTGQAVGVATLGSIYLSLAPHSISVGFATAIGIQLAISVLFAMGSRFLPRFTGTTSGRNGAMSAAMGKFALRSASPDPRESTSRISSSTARWAPYRSTRQPGQHARSRCNCSDLHRRVVSATERLVARSRGQASGRAVPSKIAGRQAKCCEDAASG